MYTGSRLQRVRLQRAPGYSKQIIYIKLSDCNVNKIAFQQDAYRPQRQPSPGEGVSAPGGGGGGGIPACTEADPPP